MEEALYSKQDVPSPLSSLDFDKDLSGSSVGKLASSISRLYISPSSISPPDIVAISPPMTADQIRRLRAAKRTANKLVRRRRRLEARLGPEALAAYDREKSESS